MSEKKSTRFQFKFAGVEIEIRGKPQFVNKMYRTILADVEEARGGHQSVDLGVDPTHDDSINKKIIWIHRCTEMMNKIYMSTIVELEEQRILKNLDLQGIGVIYCDRAAISRILPSHEDGDTLWAELTTQGKMKIAKTVDAQK